MNPENAEFGGGTGKERKSLFQIMFRVTVLALISIAVLIAELFLILLLSPSRGGSRRIQCSHNLHLIGMACGAYAGDNNEWFPDRLESLYPDYVDNARSFSCPSRQSNWPDFENHCATEESSSYILLPGLQDVERNSNLILAYEKQGSHNNAGFHVMYVGARVEWWDQARAAEFEKRLAGQREKVRNRKAATGSSGRDQDPSP